MGPVIQKYYTVLFLIFLAAIVGISYYLGYERGASAKGGTQKSIIFSCPNTVLERQRISLPASAASIETKSQEEPSQEIDSREEEPASPVATQGTYMGSKNGTKYYTPGCPASKRIKPENVIWFTDAEDATLQGYTKGSC